MQVQRKVQYMMKDLAPLVPFMTIKTVLYGVIARITILHHVQKLVVGTREGKKSNKIM